MRIPKRAALRLALAGWLGLAGLSLVAAPASAATPAAPEKVFSDSVVFFAKIQNAAALREAFRQTQYGQLWNDPALKPLREDISSRMEERGSSLKKVVGLSPRELIELPQGTIGIAVLPLDEGDQPAAIVITVDAGFNGDKLADVLNRRRRPANRMAARFPKRISKG